jgi:hypothetical protein
VGGAVIVFVRSTSRLALGGLIWGVGVLGSFDSPTPISL